MLKSWTDTHYKLADEDWLYIAKHEGESSVSLVCPGYARDGQGFSIHFTTAQIEILEHLVEALRAVKAVPVAAPISEAAPQEQYPNHQPAPTNQQLLYPVGREK
jgi:hypothetical protein